MRKATIFIVVALVLMLSGTPAYATGIPALPNAFYGTVLINGSPAPVGTTISATGDGVKTDTIQNPVKTTRAGSYGIDSLKLLVQGDILDRATITFYVTDANGTAIGGTAEWHSGETKELPLSATIPVPEVGFLPRAAPPAVYYVETSLFGIEGSFDISDDGEILETIVATSADGMLTITIEKGTIALDEDGKPLSTLTAAVDPSPPDPPEGAYVIDAYDFGPDGATFEPPIKLTWNYDPEALPEDVDLVIAYYDEGEAEWVYLPVERVNNTLTALVSHFTTFALIARAVPPPPPVVAPPPPPPPPEVVPAPPPVVAPPPPPPPPEEVVPEVPVKPIPWPLIGGIIAAVVVVALLVYFLVVRRRAY